MRASDATLLLKWLLVICVLLTIALCFELYTLSPKSGVEVATAGRISAAWLATMGAITQWMKINRDS